MKASVVRKLSTPNPIKHLRTELGLTIDELSNVIGINRNTLIRTEAGQYSQIPLAILNYFKAGFELEQSYAMWQKTMRLRNYAILHVLPIFGLPYVHPLKEWIDQSYLGSKITVNALANAFCVNYSTLHKFTATPERMDSVPADFLEALLNAGYSTSTLEDFVRAYSRYKSEIRDQIRAAQKENYAMSSSIQSMSDPYKAVI